MKIETEIGVDTDAEIVVHHEDLRVVFAGRTCYDCAKRKKIVGGADGLGGREGLLLIVNFEGNG